MSIHSDHAYFQKGHFPKAIQLREILQTVIAKRKADAILLSGGVDSALLAALDPTVTAITVVFEEGNLDLSYAKAVANHLGMSWNPILLSQKKALETISEAISLEHSYDLSAKGNIPVSIGMQFAKANNLLRIRTGDAADELFGGYSGVHEKSPQALQKWTSETIQHIALPSLDVGNRYGLTMDYPYLDEEVLAYAYTLSREDMIQDFPQASYGDVSQYDIPALAHITSWGKIVLRMAAKDLLPDNIIWRPKAPLEYGSGFNALEKVLENSFSDTYLAELTKEKKHFWNRAHAYLYLQYKNFGFQPTPPTIGEYACTWCGGGIINGRLHCKTCGAYPATQEPKELFVDAKK